MTADIDTAATAAHSPSPSRRGAAANGADPPISTNCCRPWKPCGPATSRSACRRESEGPLGRISVLFNEIVAANQNMAQQLERIGKAVGEQGRTRQRVKFGISTAAWGEMEGSVNSLIDDLVWPTTEVTRVISRGGPGRPAADRAARRRRPAAQGRVPALGQHRQHHDQAALGVHLRGDPRGARGRHRGQARRPGQGERSDRRVARADRERQLDGQQPDGPGAQHLRRHHRRGQRRPVAQDHRRRARRDPAAQGSHQHHGGPAALVRLGSDARGARGRHRRQAGRPGDRARRRRHLEGPHRLGERHVRQPDRPGAQHRRGDHRRGARRLCRRRSPSTCRARSCS